MGAPVVWFEIAGGDMEALSDFYGSVFGWKVDADNPKRYGMVDTGAEGGIPGGMYAAGTQFDAGRYLTVYVDVPDLTATIEHAERLGARVVVPPEEIGGGATVALVDDPEGHRLGLIQQPTG